MHAGPTIVGHTSAYSGANSLKQAEPDCHHERAGAGSVAAVALETARVTVHSASVLERLHDVSKCNNEKMGGEGVSPTANFGVV